MAYFRNEFAGKVFADAYKGKPFTDIGEDELKNIVAQELVNIECYAYAYEYRGEIEEAEKRSWGIINSATQEYERKTHGRA